ncbi:uncharacterized protein LOC106095721 [Stomoxys calcitrans]|uniref:uncharacterized protein LOC106095721 n=1 Tax=Stomoxys calcitrans TaxID=35570 RepID=UPI0027E36596|nr:uncharacterized protein LOC106095721 [Stomoxys calcitrans]
MLSIYKILIITLLAGIGYIEANGDIKAVEVVPKDVANLTLVESQQRSVGDTAYSFRCTVGPGKTARVTCAGHDRTTWATPHNVELTLNCPPNGQGPTIAYAEINFTVTTTNVNCLVTAGGVGYNFIQMKVNAFGTTLLDYTDTFYNY